MNPGTPFSLLLVAAGAILAWGVEDRVDALNLEAIGIILMGVGIFGLLMSLLFWSTIFGREPRDNYYVERPPQTIVRREIIDDRTHDTVDTGEHVGHRHV